VVAASYQEVNTLVERVVYLKCRVGGIEGRAWERKGREIEEPFARQMSFDRVRE